MPAIFHAKGEMLNDVNQKARKGPVLRRKPATLQRPGACRADLRQEAFVWHRRRPGFREDFLTCKVETAREQATLSRADLAQWSRRGRRKTPRRCSYPSVRRPPSDNTTRSSDDRRDAALSSQAISIHEKRNQKDGGMAVTEAGVTCSIVACVWVLLRLGRRGRAAGDVIGVAFAADDGRVDRG